MKFKWRKDPDAETILRDVVGIKWEHCEILLGDIDWDGSAQNCARLVNPLNAEKIEDYATCFSRGDTFPVVVVEETQDGYVLLGGNQRCNAIKWLASKEGTPFSEVWIEAYVVQTLLTCDREVVIRSLNSRHGWGSDKAERVEHAVYLVKQFGLHVPTVAKACVVSESTINDRLRAEETKAILAKQGVDSSKLSLTGLSQLGRVQSDEPRRRIAEVAIKNKLTCEQIKNATDAVLRCESDAKKLKAVSEWAKTIDNVKSLPPSRGMKKPRREKFFRLMQELSVFLETGNDGVAFKCMEELSCVNAIDGDKIRMLVATITNRLRCICEAQHGD